MIALYFIWHPVAASAGICHKLMARTVCIDKVWKLELRQTNYGKIAQYDFWLCAC